MNGTTYNTVRWTKFAKDMDWSNMGVRNVELPANLLNQASPIIVPVLVEEVPLYFVGNQYANTMPLIQTGYAHHGTETVSGRLSILSQTTLHTIF
jgi:hypothetical protein